MSASANDSDGVVGMRLSGTVSALQGKFVGDDVSFRGVSTDTRSLQSGNLFIALQGPNFDAHDFIAEAGERGAVAVMVQRSVSTSLPQLLVDDTRIGLGRLASLWRDQFVLPVIAVTGSNGKTTVKEMVAAILKVRGAGLVTRGNLNNDIGVPLTLLRLQAQHQYAVVEMGASRPGDIDYLSRLTRPSLAIITNAAPAHLEGFGDIAGVARAKGEIFYGLSEKGVAILNNDDPRIGLWQIMCAGHPCQTFGIRNPADFRAEELQVNEQCGCSFVMHTPAEAVSLSLRLSGRHNVMNALAASAAAYALGATTTEIKLALENMKPVSGRLELKEGVDNIRIIDDTYNANPGSVRAALEVLAATGSDGEKILVLGDMGELGNAAQALHIQVGRQARVIGINRIYAVGEQACITAGAFGKGATHYNTQDELITAICKDISDGIFVHAGLTILVKGSRSMRMDRVVDVLTGGCEQYLGRSAPTLSGGGAPGKYHAPDIGAGG